MSTRFIDELKSHKAIVSAEAYDLTEKLDFISDTKEIQSAKAELRNVEVYRFVYEVGRLHVIGYIALPRNTSEKIPCIIHLRGGTGDFGMLTPRTIYGQLVKYAREGYLVISTQYPGVEGGDGQDCFGGADDIASITKLREILRGTSIADTSTIGIKGHSRGGLMAYMILREATWVKAAVIAGAPTDQFRQGKERPNWREHQISLWGKSREGLLRRSPLRWVSELPKKVPLLLMHGSADWRVSPLDSLEMSQAMFKHAIPHRLIFFEGADHGITEYRAEYYRQSIDWLNRFLKNREQLPNLTPHGD
jgi:dipeptidyl aminopeptidase/acylaminoacyl peptidase